MVLAKYIPQILSLSLLSLLSLNLGKAQAGMGTRLHFSLLTSVLTFHAEFPLFLNIPPTLHTPEPQLLNNAC